MDSYNIERILKVIYWRLRLLEHKAHDHPPSTYNSVSAERWKNKMKERQVLLDENPDKQTTVSSEEPPTRKQSAHIVDVCIVDGKLLGLDANQDPPTWIQCPITPVVITTENEKPTTYDPFL